MIKKEATHPSTLKHNHSEDQDHVREHAMKEIQISLLAIN